MRGISRTPVVCGVDIGTTNVKVIALDVAGWVRGRHSLRTPRAGDGISTDVLALQTMVEEMIVSVCGDDLEVCAICTVGVGEDGLLVDMDRQPLTDALAWFDPRRRRLFDRLACILDPSEPADSEFDPSRTFVGWAWSRDQVRADEASSWIGVADLLAVNWTGRAFMSDTLASRSGAWSCRDRIWLTDRVEATLGSLELLPEVVRSGDVVGSLTSESLADAGVIARDALVVAGGHDHAIAGWGVNLSSPGTILDSMGTAEVVVAQTSDFDPVRGRHIDIAPGIGGRFLMRVEELARNADWASQDPDVAEAIRLLLDGREEPLPDLLSGYFIPGKRGGGRPEYLPETPENPRVRASAVLGALALAGAEAAEAVRVGLQHRSTVKLAGGWTRSPGWIAIKEAVNGYSSDVIMEPEVTAVSAALLAARGFGWDPDPRLSLAGDAL